MRQQWWRQRGGSSLPPPVSPTGGWTILELMLVLIIIGILSAIASTSYQSQREAMKQTTTPVKIKAFFDLGRQYAASLNKSVTLNFTLTAQGHLTLLTLGSTPNFLEQLELEAAPAITFTPAITKIVFKPDGSLLFYQTNDQLISAPFCRLSLFNNPSVTADILLYQNSGSSQLVKKK